MNYIKPTTEKKPIQPDYDALWDVKAVRIAVSAFVVVLSIYATGKLLRLMGQTVEDVRYFANAIKKK